MKTYFASAAAVVASSTAVLANGSVDPLCDINQAAVIAAGGSCATAVPEISALEGTAALAALAAIVLIAWERRRRAA